MDSVTLIKKAQTLQNRQQWQAAVSVWNEVVEKYNTDYQFQADACQLIATAIQMSNEIPERRSTVLTVTSGKHIYIESEQSCISVHTIIK